MSLIWKITNIQQNCVTAFTDVMGLYSSSYLKKIWPIAACYNVSCFKLGNVSKWGTSQCIQENKSVLYRMIEGKQKEWHLCMADNTWLRDIMFLVNDCCLIVSSYRHNMKSYRMSKKNSLLNDLNGWYGWLIVDGVAKRNEFMTTIQN